MSIVSITRGRATTSRVMDTLTGSMMSWSPDGKTVAVAARPSGDGAVPQLVLHSVETGQERSYSHAGLLSVPARWFLDSRRLLVAVAENPDEAGAGAFFGRSAWFSLDRQSGVWSTTSAFGLIGSVVLFTLTDDRAIYHIGLSSDPKKSNVVIKVDLSRPAPRHRSSILRACRRANTGLGT